MKKLIGLILLMIVLSGCYVSGGWRYDPYPHYYHDHYYYYGHHPHYYHRW